MHDRESARHFLYLGLRGGIVRVCTNEYVMVLVLNGPQHIGEHRADYRRFVPSRHHDGDGLLLGLNELFFRQPGRLLLRNQPTPKPPDDVNTVNECIIQPTDEEQNAAYNKEQLRNEDSYPYRIAKHGETARYSVMKRLPSPAEVAGAIAMPR